MAEQTASKLLALLFPLFVVSCDSDEGGFASDDDDTKSDDTQTEDGFRSLPSTCFLDSNTSWSSCCLSGSTLTQGTTAADTITGGSGGDCIVGYGAGDILGGSGGTDHLFGGAGQDDLDAGAGSGLIAGGGENDKIVFGSGSMDTTEGYGGSGDDVLEGGAGADSLYGEDGADELFGGSGADTLVGGKGLDVMAGGDGNDAFVASSICDLQAGEVIDGGNGSDTVSSPFTSTQLASMGVVVRNVETFTVLTTGATDQCDGLSAPTGWLTSGGLSYRRATSQELVRNNWLPGSYIVERGSGGLYYGASSANVMLPSSDSTTETLALTRVLNAESRAFGTISYDSSVAHQPQTMYFDTFEKVGSTGLHYGRVVIGDDDSLHGRLRNSAGRAFSILQLQSHHYIDSSLSSLPMSVGDAIVASPLGEGIPPGPGSKIPGTGVVVRIAYIGEGIFCMNHTEDWQATYVFDAQTVHAVHVNSETGADMSLVFGTCHLFASMEQAVTCTETDSEGSIPEYCYDADDHLYPFLDTMGGQSENLLNAYLLLLATWDSADHASEHLSMPDIGLAQIRTGRIMYNPNTGHIVAGLATGGNSNPGWGWMNSLGKSVARSGGADSTTGDLASAHEFGHNFWGDHDDAEVLMSGGYTGTIMTESLVSTLAPWFSDTNAETVEDCVDLSYCPVGDDWTP